MTSLALPSAVPLVEQPTVTGGKLKSLALRLREAEWLLLTAIPNGEAAAGLVSDLMSAVEAHDKRKRPRGKKERKALYDAAAAVAGGVLLPELRRGRMVHLSLREGDFAGGFIGYSAAKVVLAGLEAAGYLQRHPGPRFSRQEFGEGPEWSGLHTRFEATPALIDLAAARGITAETVKSSFGVRYAEKAEAVARPVNLKAFKTGRGLQDGRKIPVKAGDATYGQLRKEVALANRVLAAHSWQNCQPPQVFRTFRNDWHHGGRWITTGKPPLQHIARDARLDILIDGAAVVEVDVRGSQLSIVAALAGIGQLQRDPYQLGSLAAFKRDEVKDAVMATLGSGKLRTTWPSTMNHRQRDDMTAIAEALGDAHPYLRDLPGLLQVPPSRVALRLQAIEAECLTGALLPLWQAGVPAVPIHDSILVPVAAVAMADDALRDSYRAATGAVVTTTTRFAGSE